MSNPNHCQVSRQRSLYLARLFFAASLLILCASCQSGNTALVVDKSPQSTIRIATFNVAMGMENQTELTEALETVSHARLAQVAEILQQVRPDIILLNEFDFDPEVDAAGLLNDHYLSVAQNNQKAIHYPFHYRAAVNTGLDSGLDLNGNGVLKEANDAWGYGTFPGQYGMLILSKYPIDIETSRSFQTFRWADLPGARRPVNEDGSHVYPDEIWENLRLSSKSHWDITLDVHGQALHLLAFHPTPPVFDGPEDRNGLRNYDEIRFWAEYLNQSTADYMVDDLGRAGGLGTTEAFVIAGDFNADPNDGDSISGAVEQLLQHTRVNNTCQAASQGAIEAAMEQGGINDQHAGNPTFDTSDFNDEFTGNFRLDYVLPSKQLQAVSCGVFWPSSEQQGHHLVSVSDHRLVWLDISW